MTEEIKETENITTDTAQKPVKVMAKLPACGKLLPVAIIVGALIIAGGYFYVGQYGQQKNKCGKATLSMNDAGPKAVKFINESFFAGKETAILKGVTETNCVYQVKIEISSRPYDIYMTRDGGLLFLEGRKIETASVTPPAGQKKTTIGQFQVNDEAVCKDGEKPLVYFFGSSTCPHCKWEEPVIKEAMAKFGNLVVYKELIDATTDQDVFARYSDGSVPAIVLGCKYSRVGSGENSGLEEEAKNLTAITCKLTGGQPVAVCDLVKDLTGQIVE